MAAARRRLFALAALAALAVGLLWGGAPAALWAGIEGETVLNVLNRTGADLYGLFLAPAGSDAWGEDLLDGGRLRAGEDVKVTFPWGARAIWWDVRAENRDGASVEWKNLPLRRFRQLTLFFSGNAPVARGE